MSAPLSPIITEIFMRDLEEEALSRLPFSVPIYFRYVDDIYIAYKYYTPSDKLDKALNVFNLLHDRFNFTAEINADNSINFLNL